MPRPHVIVRAAALAVACAAIAASPTEVASAEPIPASVEQAHEGWSWPVWPFRLERAYLQPAHRYAAGHRGIDVRPLDGDEVRSPADGVVAFVGAVGGRRLITIDHGDGFVTTLEPVLSDVEPGTAVASGEVIGTLSLGGHAEPGTLHFGVRLADEYVNPLVLLGDVPRAVLLPCCD